MNTSTKLVLGGIAVDMLASWRANVARDIASVAARMGDVASASACEQQAQAFETAAIAGKAAFWYGLYQKAPKLTLAAGAVGMAAYYVPKTALAVHRFNQARAHAAAAFGRDVAAPPPMSAWQGVY